MEPEQSDHSTDVIDVSVRNSIDITDGTHVGDNTDVGNSIDIADGTHVRDNTDAGVSTDIIDGTHVADDSIEWMTEGARKAAVMIPVVLIMLAEVLLFSGRLTQAVWMHVLVLMVLSVATIYFRETELYMPFQALLLLPLLRLVNISMPVFFEMTLYSYIFIYAPLFIPVYVVAVHQKFTAAQIGLIRGNLKYMIPVAVLVGFLIAQGEYYVIHPGYLIPDLSLWNIIKLTLVMVLFIGLVEELVFRSIVQTRLEESLGMFYGLVVTSIMFGIMHSGYGTYYEMLFTSLAGLIIGYMFQRTRDLPLITLTHGMVNVFLFGFIPHLGPGMGLI